MPQTRGTRASQRGSGKALTRRVGVTVRKDRRRARFKPNSQQRLCINVEGADQIHQLRPPLRTFQLVIIATARGVVTTQAESGRPRPFREDSGKATAKRYSLGTTPVDGSMKTGAKTDPCGGTATPTEKCCEARGISCDALVSAACIRSG